MTASKSLTGGIQSSFSVYLSDLAFCLNHLVERALGKNYVSKKIQTGVVRASFEKEQLVAEERFGHSKVVLSKEKGGI